MFHEKTITLLLALLLILAPAGPAQAADSGASPNNLINGGLAVSDGRFAYYAAYDGIYASL